MKRTLETVLESYHLDGRILPPPDAVAPLEEQIDPELHSATRPMVMTGDTSYTYLYTRDEKETAIFQFDNIPEELKSKSHWVGWKYERKEGEDKLTKVPYQVSGRKKAMTNNPATWGSFSGAVDAFNRKLFDGIGYVFTSDDGYVGIDLDGIITDRIDPEHERYIRLFNSYTEITPSLSGVHIIVKGTLPPFGRKKHPVEMYSEGRFFTFTGNRLEFVSPTIEERQEIIDEFHTTFFPERMPRATVVTTENVIDLEDEELISRALRAKRGDKFGKLWRGDWTDYASHSEADMALCSMLSFWTGREQSRIDILFRSSGLFREKWDEAHFEDGTTYGEATIRRAMENPDVYHAPKRSTSKIDYEFILACYWDNEFGDANIIRTQCQGQYLYDHEADRWYSFKTNWEEDRTNSIREMVRQVLQTSYQSLLWHLIEQKKDSVSEDTKGKEDNGSSKLIDGIQRRITELNTLKRINTVMKILQGGQYFGIRGDEWDSDPWILGTKNAVIDLRSGSSRQTLPEDHIRKYAPVEWKGLNEPAPRWEQFIFEIMGEDQKKEKPLSDFLQRLLGYSIIGLQLEAQLPILFGQRGRNGKETLFETIRHVLGSLAMPQQRELLMDSNQRRSGQASPELYDLHNVRIAWISETGDGDRINSAMAKHLTGNGTITCRQVYSKNITRFSQSHQMFLFTNHKPRASSDDDALWARIILVPFELSFVENPTEPYQRMIDKHLRPKLAEEASGIVAWLVRGCLEYQRVGLSIPQRIKDITKQYRKGEDLMSLFLDENVEFCPDAEGDVQSIALYLRYSTWSIENGYRPMSNKRFAEKLPSSFTKVKKKDANYYKGIRLIARSDS